MGKRRKRRDSYRGKYNNSDSQDVSKMNNAIKDINVCKRDTREIYETATRHFNTIVYKNSTLYRLMVNTARHELSNYENTLKGMKVSKNEYKQYKNAVLDKISKTYPNLTEECENQKSKVSMVRTVKKRKRKGAK